MPATGYCCFKSRTAGFLPKGQCADDLYISEAQCGGLHQKREALTVTLSCSPPPAALQNAGASSKQPSVCSCLQHSIVHVSRCSLTCHSKAGACVSLAVGCFCLHNSAATLQLIAPDRGELSGVLLLILPPAHVVNIPVAKV